VDLVKNHLDPLLSCALVTDAFDDLYDDTCVVLVDSLFYLTLAAATIGTLFIPGLVAGILGSKRFDSKNHSDGGELYAL